MRGKSVSRSCCRLSWQLGPRGGCANNGVQPGIVNTASASSYGGRQSMGCPEPRGGDQRRQHARAVAGGSSGSGPSNMPALNKGDLLGGLGGIAIGASGGRGVGGGLIGGVLGAVGGAIAGTIIDRHTTIGGGGRGIEVVVQRDDGQQVTVAQRDDGDVQLGDRVQIVQGRGGVAKAVRDNSRQQDYHVRRKMVFA